MSEEKPYKIPEGNLGYIVDNWDKDGKALAAAMLLQILQSIRDVLDELKEIERAKALQAIKR